MDPVNTYIRGGPLERTTARSDSKFASFVDNFEIKATPNDSVAASRTELNRSHKLV